MKSLIVFLFVYFMCSCQRHENNPSNLSAEFTEPVRVAITGYTGHSMEPFLSRDGSILFFNNLNDPSENTNLHWALRINDSIFQYQGEVSGTNTIYLEGVPSLDTLGNLYFVSTRSYTTTLSAVYSCNFSNGVATNVQLVNGISNLQPGWINFDVEINADGQTLYSVDGQLDPNGIPRTADLIVAQKTSSGFLRSSNSNDLMKNINTTDLEYAACISVDQLELYFTRLKIPITANSVPEIFRAVRQNKNEAFGVPEKIKPVTGFVEAATLAPDQKTIYYHKKENGLFVLYLVKKK